MKIGNIEVKRPSDVVHVLEKAEQAVAVILFNVILLSLFWQAVSRKIGTPSSWTDEMSRLLFVWMGVLGCHIAQRENIHVRIDAILLSLPKKIQLVIADFLLHLLNRSEKVVHSACNPWYRGKLAVRRDVPLDRPHNPRDDRTACQHHQTRGSREKVGR